MNLPPLPPIGDSTYVVRGPVTLHPSAAIAPGVLLQADPDSQLVIGAGVCIGRDAILHAQAGTLTVEAGASLGSRVLLVGNGAIGENACIGTAATLINPEISPGELVPPNALLGDRSRQASDLQEDPMAATGEDNRVEAAGIDTAQVEPAPDPLADPAPPPADPPPPPSSNGSTPPPGVADPGAMTTGTGAIANGKMLGGPVYGKEAIERLMSALFPHRSKEEG